MATPVNYLIYLTNQSQVALLQAAYPTGIQIPPNAAAATYGVPIGTNDLTATGGITIWPPDSVGFSVDLVPSYGTQTFNVTYTDMGPTTSGFPNPYPTTIACYWVGYFLATGSVNTAPPGGTQRYIGARRWAEGFEIPTNGQGGAGGVATRMTRDASRTSDGFGFSYRSIDNQLLTYTLGVTTRISWERLYLRPRKLGTSSEDNIWSCNGSVEGTAALILNVTSGGVLKLYALGNAPQVYPGDLLVTGPTMVVGTWYKVDIRLQFTTLGAGNGSASLYVNGVLYGTGVPITNGLATSQNHATSSVGAITAATSHALEIDMDDWIDAAEVPYINAVGDAALAPGNELTTGSHVVLARPTGFGALHSTAAWLGTGTALAGNYREVNLLPANANTSGVSSGLVSTTAASVLQVETDYVRQQFGVASIAIGAFPTNVSGVAGSTLGFTTALGTSDTTVTFTAATWTARQAAYSVATGATIDTLPDIETLTLKAVMGNGAGTNRFVSLFAATEFIGYWGPEDTSPTTPTTQGVRVGVHNHPYPTLNENHTINGPIAAIRVKAGLYTGNALGLDVFTAIAPQWWFVRALTGSNNGVIWHSGLMTSHKFLAQKFEPSQMPQARLHDGVAKLQVTGSSVDNNASLVTYQYVAISDIGMRFMLNGAFAHESAVASAINTLIDSGFTPDAAFLYVESYSAGTTGHYYKGPGHTTDRASPLDTADVAGIATFGAGTITSKTAIHTDNPQTGFNAWRKLDGTGAPQWFDVMSYVGNGAVGNRNITVAINGQTPLFVMVFPHNDVTFFRDPSFTGTTCGRINATTSTTGIVGGGVNFITVNTALNTNLIVYDVFVIGGGSVAFTNGTFTPAVEVQRTGGPWAANPAPVAITPVTLSVPAQWRLHRMDIKQRREERS